VGLGIALTGTSPENVDFSSAAELADGRFAGDVDLTGLPFGSYELWARACLGERCGDASVPLEPQSTALSLTPDSATSGQYFDPVHLEARLSAGDDPIAKAALAFALGPRTFTATTDADGLASVDPTLSETPGEYELQVRYAGSAAYQPISATAAFTVAKEDTDLILALEGRGKQRRLVARLSDRDTPSDGVAQGTIDFAADGKPIGSALTDDDGVATLAVPARYQGGRHAFEARFAGDDFYLGSSATTRT
jgi:hypothetical protein